MLACLAGPEWKLEEELDPIIFLKPMTAVAWPGEPVVLPPAGKSGTGPHQGGDHGVQHEVELAVIIGSRVPRGSLQRRGGSGEPGECTDDEAMSRVAGYCLALDVTDRDAQTQAKVPNDLVSRALSVFLLVIRPCFRSSVHIYFFFTTR